jgi:uncharacterized protein YcfJ
MKKLKISKAGTLLGTGGAVVGGLIAFNKGGGIGKVVLIAAVLGVGGVLLGNAVTKFYE